MVAQKVSAALSGATVARLKITVELDVSGHSALATVALLAVVMVVLVAVITSLQMEPVVVLLAMSVALEFE